MQRRLSSWPPFLAALGLILASGNDVCAAEPNVPLSLGYPNAGKLLGGQKFRENPCEVMVPAHAHSRVRWALPELLSVLKRASRIVAHKFPGSVLEIGELSRHGGGPSLLHRSHQNGRDADVSFYYVDLDGNPVQVDRFMRCDADGTTHDDPTVRFDEKRNWAFVRAVLEDPVSEVRQIFIWAPLRARLLAYAAKIHAPHDVRVKAARAMMQPLHALPHDDHFHIRISCPADQIGQGCADLPLWRTPGSVDAFGPELLAEASTVASNGGAAGSHGSPNETAKLDAWGDVTRYWSNELGLCVRVLPMCPMAEGDPACRDPADFASTASAPAAPPSPVAMGRESPVAMAHDEPHEALSFERIGAQWAEGMLEPRHPAATGFGAPSADESYLGEPIVRRGRLDELQVPFGHGLTIGRLTAALETLIGSHPSMTVERLVGSHASTALVPPLVVVAERTDLMSSEGTSMALATTAEGTRLGPDELACVNRDELECLP